MRTHESICIGIPRILLPKAEYDPAKWAVIACDQFTSEREYWKNVSDFVGAAPSALNIIFPEIYLNDPDKEDRILGIREHMKRYLERNIFNEAEGFVYVERTTGSATRKGLVACLDLDRYDFRKGSTSLIRATEGTILERIPPRIKIREGAPLELPHIMVLIDDPENKVIGRLTKNRGLLKNIYDFELMMGSGHLSGFLVEDPAIENGIIQALKALADPAAFVKKYGLPAGTPVLLYAMGDGNHSLATAKTIWEKTKENAADKKAVMNSALRYALVELVNLHDKALVFEPIHRVLFETASGRNALEEMKSFYPAACRIAEVRSLAEMKSVIDSQKGAPHKIGFVAPSGFGVVEVAKSDSHLPVGTLQNFLDVFIKNKGAKEIDYVHGTESVTQLGSKPGNMGFYLPAMNKYELFKTVILDGILPRKTFSMGEAAEKRFYMEARKLS